MRKYFLTIMAFFLILSLGMQPTYAQEANQLQPQQKVELTDQQKDELSTLYQDLFAKRKEIINKKVEFGMISKEMGDKMISKMDEHFEMLKQNNFMFHWDKDKKHHGNR